jgi:ATP phosphoribosyltransferase
VHRHSGAAHVEECRSFFRDLCTPAELQAMADRWAVVELLERGLPYREIHKQTGVSVTTIGRVARYLTSGNGGYRAVTERLKLNEVPRMRLKIAIQKSGRLTDSSLDLLSRCGLKFSRGKDQLMCYGENMPLDVLFVRDDDIPDLVQEDVCDLGLVGLNVVEEKRLAFQARGLAPLFETVQLLDFGRCKLCIAVPDGFEYRGAESLQGKRIATTYPQHSRAFSCRTGHQSRGRGAVGCRGNRTAPGPRGCDLRPGVHRLDAGRESSAPGRNRAGESGGTDPHAGAHPAGKAGMDPAPA